MRKHYDFHVLPQYDSLEFRSLLELIAHGRAPVSFMLKEDKTTTVWASSFRDTTLVVKRYNTKSLWHAVRRIFQRSRAENCRLMTKAFDQAGITTAPFVAMIQERFGPFKIRSWYICEYVSGSTLYDYFYTEETETRRCSEIELITQQVIDVFERLNESQLSHGDFKASNIIISENGLCLIDLDGAQQHKRATAFHRAYRKDRVRFMKNWLDAPAIYTCFRPLLDL